MPGRDGTGPVGMGNMSGRGMGFCRHADERRALNKCRFGFGHGLKRSGSLRFSETRTQMDFLTEQKSLLENRLEIINKRLESL